MTAMAIYHLHVKVIGRKAGSSAVASAAYRSASRMHDERIDRVQDFPNKPGVVHSEVMLPENAAGQWSDRERLWNDVEAFEVRKDAQLAREVEFAIPREMSEAQGIRKTIIRDQLTDPRFYDEMSKLLEDLIKQSRDSAEAYEAFLKKAEELVRKLAAREAGPDLPAGLHGNREATVVFNNLQSLPAHKFTCPADEEQRAELALEIDRAIREHAPAGWKGDPVREREVKNVLFPLFNRDREATLAMFEIIKNQQGY